MTVDEFEKEKSKEVLFIAQRIGEFEPVFVLLQRIPYEQFIALGREWWAKFQERLGVIPTTDLPNAEVLDFVMAVDNQNLEPILAREVTKELLHRIKDGFNFFKRHGFRVLLVPYEYAKDPHSWKSLFGCSLHLAKVLGFRVKCEELHIFRGTRYVRLYRIYV